MAAVETLRSAFPAFRRAAWCVLRRDPVEKLAGQVTCSALYDAAKMPAHCVVPGGFVLRASELQLLADARKPGALIGLSPL
eukprot:10402352-Prorocentrum_lima.AAC.1